MRMGTDASEHDRSTVMTGTEPLSLPGGPHGALLLHGFTGSPQSMRRLGRALAAVGFAVEVPLLPGHGTTPDDLAEMAYEDWRQSAEDAYAKLAAQVDKVVVAGISMGGALTAELAIAHPELAGAVFVNATVGPPDPDVQSVVRNLAAAGETRLPPIGSSIADPTATEIAYDWTPVAPLLSLIEGSSTLPERLATVTCPILIFTSVHDPVVIPLSSDRLADAVSGPVERVPLERSYHVATLDYDKDEIERRTVAFARRVTAAT
jgi:carboxylesterase